MKATIWHNPHCSKSRATLALLREAGVEPVVIAYLETPPDAAELARLFDRAGIHPRAGLRRGEAGASILLDADAAAIPAAMAADPILIERPLVETERGVRLCRPPERVRDIL